MLQNSDYNGFPTSLSEIIYDYAKPVQFPIEPKSSFRQPELAIDWNRPPSHLNQRQKTTTERQQNPQTSTIISIGFTFLLGVCIAYCKK